MSQARTSLRLATWNVEWFDQLFDEDGQPLQVQEHGRYGVPKARQLDAIAGVLRAIDADAIVIQEAPDTSMRRAGGAALEIFAEQAGLRMSRSLLGFPNDTQQEIALLYDPDRVTPSHAPGQSPEAPRFDRIFQLDVDLDLRADRLAWSKPPLEIDLEVEGEVLHLIGVHAKSKAARGAKDADDAMRIAIQNRRKQLAQCIWLRRRVDQRLAEGRRLIVAGDFNDGPGLDRFEALFGRSGLEIVLGDGPDALYDPAARPPRLGAAQPATARFWDSHAECYMNALIDFAMVDAGLVPRAHWTILHPFDAPRALKDPALQRDLLDASDHFPVILDLAPASPHI
ncbi:endonuclease/exonuclease/phosphatase family protein [Jannaschia seohaensis]|uniref:Endonuclease/exonuclease/phosphatase family protein n=1 Tax=Jannaschia seohaensis TaxID=475081 RepID=A0A2Y9A2U3_9RHOB|nr:endonuclease/exonuclease/phosphatase family protein [Jannaschia seohaensis]PWJ22502.1 endonuclease/exonuclease/phosphatase family protein [Jannaschia seohaensis]SSA38780.1 Endonuclease/Exonuclease/phosphatase family protein [Jannaschia seohaensis]